jgi:hypothetical protein
VENCASNADRLTTITVILVFQSGTKSHHAAVTHISLIDSIVKCLLLEINIVCYEAMFMSHVATKFYHFYIKFYDGIILKN